jgi:hypothetical protein
LRINEKLQLVFERRRTVGVNNGGVFQFFGAIERTLFTFEARGGIEKTFFPVNSDQFIIGGKDFGARNFAFQRRDARISDVACRFCDRRRGKTRQKFGWRGLNRERKEEKQEK